MYCNNVAVAMFLSITIRGRAIPCSGCGGCDTNSSVKLNRVYVGKKWDIIREIVWKSLVNLSIELIAENLKIDTPNSQTKLSWYAPDNNVIFLVVPSSPNNFTITKVSSNSVRFSWLKDESKIINNFTVERRSASEFDWVTISSTIVSPWFEDENLPPFTTFIYRVSATNVLGTSEHSESFDISTKEGGMFYFEIELELITVALYSYFMQISKIRSRSLKRCCLSIKFYSQLVKQHSKIWKLVTR